MPSDADRRYGAASPVGEEESPALSADKLRGYGMEVYEAQLTEVVRQMHDSGILWNATELRRYISEENFLTLPSVRVEGFRISDGLR